MLHSIAAGRWAVTPPVPGVRGRPVISGGTLRTDTGQIIRGGAAQIGNGTSGALFKNVTWAAARALGLNTMRCGMNPSSASLSVSALLANVDEVVELARVNRMYAMLGCFQATPGDWDLDVAGNTAKWKAVWAAAGARYKDLPWVFFEMVNEPTGTGGVSTYSAAAKEGLKQIYDTMRAAAPDTVIAFPSPANLSPSAAQYIPLMRSFDGLGNGQPLDWTKTVLSFHYYNQTIKLAVSGGVANATDEGEAGLRAMLAAFPCLMTETNWWMPPAGDPHARNVLINGLDLMEKLGCGWILLREPGDANTIDPTAAFEGDLFSPGNAPLANKIAQMIGRGCKIPKE